MNPRKVIVADDHDIFNLGLKVGIEQDPFYKVVKEANNGEDVLTFLKVNKCDLLICDYLLPGIDGIKVIKHARRINPEIKSILISSIEKYELQNLCEKNKIDAYIFKSEARSKIVEVANLIFRNQNFRPIPGIEVDQNNPFIRLSSKELEVLRFWMLGRTMQDTGEVLKINSKTVESHRTNIKKKFPSLTKEEIFGLMKQHVIV